MGERTNEKGTNGIEQLGLYLVIRSSESSH